MAIYRVYTLDDDHYLMGPAEIIACDSDGEALAQARAFLTQFTLEVWQKDRRIAVLLPDESTC